MKRFELVLILLTIVATLVFLVLLVLGLHRYQLSVTQSNADKHDPLPPLDNVTLDPNLPDLSLEEELPEFRPLSPASGPTINSASDRAHSQFETKDGDTQILVADGITAGQEQVPSGSQSAPSIRHISDAEDTQISLPQESRQSRSPAVPEADETTEIQFPGRTSGSADRSGQPTTPASGPDQATRPVEAAFHESSGRPEASQPEPGTDSIGSGAMAGPETVDLQRDRDSGSQPAPANHQPGSTSRSPRAEDITEITTPDDRAGTLSAGNARQLKSQSGNPGQHTGATMRSPSAASQHTDTSDADAPQENWQEQIAELKKLDRLDEALQVCLEQLPLWSAYQQASLIHRARIKQLSQQGQDIEEELTALYQLAAQASFLHDRVKGLPNLPLSQLKQVDLEEVTRLAMPYARIGYNELRLIKKTDIKLLLENWGKPTAHIKPRELHSDVWKSLIARRQTTLF